MLQNEGRGRIRGREGAILSQGKVTGEIGTLLMRLGIDERFERAAGLELFTAAGASFLDMTASYGALPFGHNPPFAVEAVTRFFSEGRPGLLKGNPNYLEAEAGERICAEFGAERAIFTSGGSETVNLALKAARAITGRRKVLAFWNSFHGTTGDALRATGNRSFREAFSTSLGGDEVLCEFNGAESVRAAMDAHGGDIAAIVFEPVQGEGGVIPADDGFLALLRSVASASGALLVADEIQTGLGRCGALSHSLASGVEPDLLLLSKGLGAGIVPVGCCLFRGVWESDLGWLHSSTFGGNGLAMALVPRVLDQLDQTLLGNVRRLGARLGAGLAGLAAGWPQLVREARHQGLLAGLEFQADPPVGSRFLRELVAQFGLLPAAVAHVRHAHRICLATTLNTHNTLRVTPPLTVDEDAIERTLTALADFLESFRKGDTARVVPHLLEKTIGTNTAELRQQQLEAWRRRPVPIRDGRPSVAFLVHPNSAAYLRRFDPGFAALDRDALAKLAANLPRVIEPVDWHSFDVRGMRVQVWASPFLPTQITTMGRRTWIDEVEVMVLKAREQGSRLVGLGGLLSVVTRDGQAVSDFGVAVTTGNSLTAFAAHEALLELTSRHHTGARPPLAILGGYGNIGLALAALALRDGFDVILFGNPVNPLRRQMLDWAQRELASSGPFPGKLTLGERLVDHVDRPLIVLTATSDPEFRLDLAQFAAGSTVLDLAMPPNLDAADAAVHPRLHVYSVGRVEMPVEIPGLHLLELERTIYGCLAETIVLGLEEDWCDYSRGRLRIEKVLAIGTRARALGFRSAFDPVLAPPATAVPGSGPVETLSRSSGA